MAPAVFEVQHTSNFEPQPHWMRPDKQRTHPKLTWGDFREGIRTVTSLRKPWILMLSDLHILTMSSLYVAMEICLLPSSMGAKKKLEPFAGCEAQVFSLQFTICGLSMLIHFQWSMDDMPSPVRPLLSSQPTEGAKFLWISTLKYAADNRSMFVRAGSGLGPRSWADRTRWSGSIFW